MRRPSGFLLSSFSLALTLAVIGCARTSSSTTSGGSPSAPPQQAPTSEAPTATADTTTQTWACTTINFRRGGIESASTQKVIQLSAADENHQEVLSENSLNRIVLNSNAGTLTLQVRTRVAGEEMSRGAAIVPLSAGSVILFPNNNLMGNDGFSYARCETGVRPRSELPSTEATWSCADLSNVSQQDAANIETRRRVRISINDRDKITTLFETRDSIVVASSDRGSFSVHSRPKIRSTDRQELFRVSTIVQVDALRADRVGLFPDSGGTNGRFIDCRRESVSTSPETAPADLQH